VGHIFPTVAAGRDHGKPADLRLDVLPDPRRPGAEAAAWSFEGDDPALARSARGLSALATLSCSTGSTKNACSATDTGDRCSMGFLSRSMSGMLSRSPANLVPLWIEPRWKGPDPNTHVARALLSSGTKPDCHTIRPVVRL
jgi:hypothetical protein